MPQPMHRGVNRSKLVVNRSRQSGITFARKSYLMKKTIIASLLFLHGFYSNAQKSLLTIEDAVVNNRRPLAVKNLRQAQFVYGTDDLVFLNAVDGKDTWIKQGSAAPFLTLEGLNQKLKAAGVEEVKAMPVIQFNQSADWRMTVGGAKIALNPLTGKQKFWLIKPRRARSMWKKAPPVMWPMLTSITCL